MLANAFPSFSLSIHRACATPRVTEFSSDTHQNHVVQSYVLCVCFTLPKTPLDSYFVLKSTVLQEQWAFSDPLYEHLSY